MPTLHTVIPCFNENITLERSVRRLVDVPWGAGWRLRVVIVDDHSSDGSTGLARGLADEMDLIEMVTLPENLGKGGAVRVGIGLALESAAEDDLVVIQDADLEYDPSDLPGMVARFDEGTVDAVIGDRFRAGRKPSGLGRTHMSVNRGLTWLSNRCTGLGIEDMECCYKMLSAPMARRILGELSETRFGIEPQIVAALSRHRARVENHRINYDARRFEDGKKIGIRDGIRAIYVILREAFRRRTAA